MSHYRSIYASFDQYPSTKGAGTHIREMIEVLFGSYRDGLLLVPGSQNLPSEEVGNGYVTRRCSLLAKNFLERMAEFSHFLKANALYTTKNYSPLKIFIKKLLLDCKITGGAKYGRNQGAGRYIR